jgi:tetratricopeptide (TPR) repeat protein
MTAYMLLRRANIAYRGRDARRSIDLAAAAHQHIDGVDHHVLALAAQQEARGWAALGDYEHAGPLLDQAATLLSGADVPAPDAPAYAHHYGLAVLEDQRATCLRDAGQPEQAIVLYERHLSEIPAHNTRDRGYRCAQLALAYGHASRFDDAATLGLQALTLARATGSARAERELAPLPALLNNVDNLPKAQVLREALREPAA